MKKLIFVLALTMSSFFSAQAGYVVKGISIPGDYDDLKNYTLTFKGGEPVAAASMHDATNPYGSITGKNTIVIIEKNSLSALLFQIGSVEDTFNDIEVRDFHYYQNNDIYVLCGSREPVPGARRAFVAVINVSLSLMRFYEYSAADMFYSMSDPNFLTPSTDYYLCGTSGTRGVIASVNRGTLNLTNFYVTNNDWEYHKIIIKRYSTGSPNAPYFIVSGRNPECTRIGFTTLNVSFATVNSYMWTQATSQPSHCVVSEDVLVSNSVILASSNESEVTLNPVTYPLPVFATVPAYRFQMPHDKYHVQDIGAIRLANNTTRISVAGFRTEPSQSVAWHGYVDGISTALWMRNNDYSGTSILYEHYKIRHQGLDDYTGGSFYKVTERGALFATPLTPADDPDCDDNYPSDFPDVGNPFVTSFTLTTIPYTPTLPPSPYWGTGEDMDILEDCLPFKGAEVPKSAIAAENDSEIITLYDRITLQDVPENTSYQIYNVVGQLVQTGATNPDISTAQLNKGVYILRLESGKTFKFVK